MAFYLEAEMRERGRRVLGGSRVTAAEVLHEVAARTFDTEVFDVFLSHSYSDADAILGIYNLLSAQGVSVYVDWIVDSQFNRTHVNGATAAALRQRMKQCRSLIYTVSASSQSSAWMPWELGYFDGHGGAGRVSIMPLVGRDEPGYPGQEYLDLYPTIEELPLRDVTGRLVTAAVRPDGQRSVTLKNFTQGCL